MAMLTLAACAPLHPASTPEQAKPSAASTAPSRDIEKPAPASAAATKPATAATATSRVAPKAAPAAVAKTAPSPKTEPEASRPAPKAQAEAPLDLKSLEQRLKDTNAIGLMTKLSLKNQVDDLLAKFREYHRGQLKATLAELRRPYELLLMKVLSLLQDADPALAKAINASREAIWSVLTDRQKFSQFT